VALSDDTEAFSAYLNGHRRARALLAPDQLEVYEQDMGKAKAAMERAWLEDIGVTTTSSPDGW
jgi:hypothetical protein